jgi:hypothetical protein
MNKKLIAAFTAVLLLAPLGANAALKNQSYVAGTPTLVIIDTALDNKINVLPGKIAYEVCILDWPSCPNGKNFMEGPDAALLPYALITKNGFEHGTQMASIAVANNPNMQIVFIRIIGATNAGVRQLTSEKTVYNALQWVIDNKAKFNIQAVSMSQGRHDFPASLGANYCPNTPTTKSKIQALAAMNVPTFFPAGNGRDYKRIDWPACLDESISVGAVDRYGEITMYSNYDILKTDFYALGNTQAVSPGSVVGNVAGTSASVQVAAAQWVAIKQAHPDYTYSQMYDLVSSTSSKAFNSQIPSAKLINPAGAINGK